MPIIILIDLITIYLYYRAKASKLFLLLMAFLGIIWVVMNIPYFYSVIGGRIEDMMTTWLGIGHGHYSHSTDVREYMIVEGFRLAWDYPLFGGGWNYFASQTHSGYAYSHCNYTELLCNFGFGGFLLYYIPYFYNMYALWNKRQWNRPKATFGVMWLIMIVVLGWSMVQFSEICINYFPMVASFALLDSFQYRYRMEIVHQQLTI